MGAINGVILVVSELHLVCSSSFAILPSFSYLGLLRNNICAYLCRPVQCMMSIANSNNPRRICVIFFEVGYRGAWFCIVFDDFTMKE